MTDNQMSYFLNDQASMTEYKISLSNFNLDLIPKMPGFDKLGLERLWTTDKRRTMFAECDNECFQYHLINKESSDGDPDQLDSKPINAMIFCHICNLEIPKTHRADHNMSDKHNICFKLAKESLSRINKHLTYESEIDTPKVITNTHYCNYCNTIVEDAQEKHENNRRHKLALKKNKLFQIIFDIYMHDDITDEPFDSVASENHDKKKGFFSDTAYSHSSNESLDSEAYRQVEDIDISDDEDLAFNTQMDKFCNDSSLPQTSSNTRNIKPSDGASLATNNICIKNQAGKITSPPADFSFNEDSNRIMKLSFANTNLKNSEHISLKLNVHDKPESNVISDSHVGINHCDTKNSIKNTGLINSELNSRLEFTSDAINTDTASTLNYVLTQQVKSDSDSYHVHSIHDAVDKETEISEPESNVISISHVGINHYDTGHSRKNTGLINAEQRSRVEFTRDAINTDTASTSKYVHTPQIKSDSDSHFVHSIHDAMERETEISECYEMIVESSKNVLNLNVMCKICNVEWEVINFVEHLNSENHYLNVWLKEQDKLKVQLKDPHAYYCSVCKVFVSNVNIFKHNKGFSHTNVLKELICQLKQENMNTGHIVCNVCNEKFSTYEFELHVSERYHREKAKLQLMKMPEKCIAENPGAYLCTFCNVIVVNEGESLKAHVNSKKHEAQLLAQRYRQLKPLCPFTYG